MGKLSELVRRDYDEEVKIIKDAGGRMWEPGDRRDVHLVFSGAWRHRKTVSSPQVFPKAAHLAPNSFLF